jgi:hypothetical protein
MAGWDGEVMKPGGGALSGFDSLSVVVYAVCASES